MPQQYKYYGVQNLENRIYGPPPPPWSIYKHQSFHWSPSKHEWKRPVSALYEVLLFQMNISKRMRQSSKVFVLCVIMGDVDGLVDRPCALNPLIEIRSYDKRRHISRNHFTYQVLLNNMSAYSHVFVDLSLIRLRALGNTCVQTIQLGERQECHLTKLVVMCLTCR